MANKITVTNINPNRFVSALSRYLNSTVIYWGNQNKLTFETYVRKPYVPNAQDKFMVITPGSEYRPDLVSKNVYGTPDFWWRIKEINNIMDVFDFKAGLNIRLPSNVFMF